MGRPDRAHHRTPATSTPLVAGVAVLALLVLTGCTSTREQAREGSVTRVRAMAETLREDLAGAGRGSSGEAQLEAVRAALPDLPLTPRPDGEGVTVTGAMTATSETGGGLSYESFVARLCLSYRIAPGSGETEVADAPCPADLAAVAPADETVRLRE
ncbi:MULTISPECIES: hypothetical protein [unclassified Knoellia]|uniref:hypothetical protein n=1 Tax=Knoellia altitudinis TaxID=3404795 RepID=UPI0036149488